MHLLLLVRDPAVHTARRLAGAAAQLGHHLAVRPLSSLLLSGGGRRATLPGATRADSAWLRPGGPATAGALGALRVLQAGGVHVLHPPAALEQLYPRAALLGLLAWHGVPVTPFCDVAAAADLDRTVRALGGAPLRLSSERHSGAVLEMSASTRAEVLQHGAALLRSGRATLSAAGREHVRVLAVGGRAVAALAVEPRGPAAVWPPRTVARLAEDATAALGLCVAGVDVVRLGRGYAVASVTASPSLHAMEVLHRADLARLVVETWAQAAGA